ncbi:MAG: hypothetical protein J6K21_00385 [Bacilli bacterium]|nr:hypothetical protein [Bacilli bacterium]
MKINVQNLKNDLLKLNKLIEDYENNYLNIYKEMSQISFFWNDAISKKFFKELELEKIKIMDNINEIKELKSIYFLIVEKYEKLGNNIKVNLKNKDSVLSLINRYYNKVNEIFQYYSNLNLYNIDYKIQNSIYNEKLKVKEILKNIEHIKDEFKDKMNTIEQIEISIKNKINSINISYFKEIEVL